jgi:hypothetical protein
VGWPGVRVLFAVEQICPPQDGLRSIDRQWVIDPISAGDGAGGPRRDRERVGFSRDLLAEPVEEGLHGVGGDDRQHRAEGGVALGPGGAEQVDGPIVQALGRWSFTPVCRLPRWNHERPGGLSSDP